MSIFFENHKNIFEILKEDDGSDIINGGDAGASDADSTAANTTDNGSGDADASSTTTDDNAGGDDEEFNIDTSLDDNGDEGEEDVTGEGDDSGLDDTSSGGAATSTEEPVPANKDILTTLTAEEQAIKIKEQKKQFNDMYIYIDDLIDKIGDIELDEDNTEVVERVSKRLYNLREYLNEYITAIFATKDYISNDIFYRRFLQVIYSIDTIMQDLAKSRAKKLGLELDEDEKK